MKSMLVLGTLFSLTLAYPAFANDQACDEKADTRGESKLMLLSRVMDAQATSRAGEKVGALKDLLIDSQTGKITHAIVNCSEIAGISDRLVPVPWKALTFHSDKQFTINVDNSRMARAPEADEPFTDLTDPAYIVTIERYYIVPSEIGGAESPEGADTGAESSWDQTPKQTDDSDEE